MTLICIKSRIYPAHARETTLGETREACKGLYNSLLNSRRFEYEVHGEWPSLCEQINAVTAYRKQFTELACVHSHVLQNVATSVLQNVATSVLQNVATSVDLAFKAFFRRVKTGETPGFPRRKGDGDDSFRDEALDQVAVGVHGIGGNP